MAKPRSKSQRERDRLETSKLYLEGHNQYEIAKRIGVSQGTVSNDIKVLIRYWRISQQQNINSAKEIELAKINKLELEYWQAWEKSKEEKKTVSKKRREKTEIESNAKIEQSVGDPRYLQGVQWCINKRAEILGLNAPTKSELTGKDGGPVETKLTIEIVGDEEKDYDED